MRHFSTSGSLAVAVLASALFGAGCGESTPPAKAPPLRRRRRRPPRRRPRRRPRPARTVRPWASGAHRRRQERLRPRLPGLDVRRFEERKGRFHGRGQQGARRRRSALLARRASSSAWAIRRERSTRTAPRTPPIRSTRSPSALTRCCSREAAEARTRNNSSSRSGRQNPDSVGLTVYLAEVKSIEGDSPGCQQLAQQALAKQPNYKDAMVVIARDYYRHHRWDLARYALQAILDGADDGSIPPRDKGNAEALLLRGLIERDMGQRKQAIDDFEQACSRRPDLFEAYVNLGEMKLEAGNATEAQTPLEKAVGLRAQRRRRASRPRRLLPPSRADRRREEGARLRAQHGFDARRRPLRSRVALPLLAVGPRCLQPGRPAHARHPRARELQVDAQREDAEGAGGRRRGAPEHREAKAERAPDEEPGGGASGRTRGGSAPFGGDTPGAHTATPAPKAQPKKK